MYLAITLYSGDAICIIQCNWLVPTMSLGHLFTEMCDATKRWPSDKVKKHCETNLKVHCIIYAALSRYKVFRWHPLNIRL